MSFEAFIICDTCGAREQIPYAMTTNRYWRDAWRQSEHHVKEHGSTIFGWTETERRSPDLPSGADRRKHYHRCAACAEARKDRSK